MPQNAYSKNERIPAKPFLKWAGGKRQLLEKFTRLFPAELKEKKIKYFHEPFLGSGAVFLHIAQSYHIQTAYLYDINPELVLTFRVIQNDVEKLLELLDGYQKTYSALSRKDRVEFYYEQRAGYNQERIKIKFGKYSENWFRRAAQFIFLNRTCFNGLYRVNSKGEFNSPAGDYENPLIFDEDNLLAVSRILSIAEIKTADFRAVLDNLKPESFVYFDPPYRPISKTAHFRSYSDRGFDDGEQSALASIFRKVDQIGAKVMLSNSDPKNISPEDDFFDQLFTGYTIIRVPARRRINSKVSGRGVINEIVVTNYQV